MGYFDRTHTADVIEGPSEELILKTSEVLDAGTIPNRQAGPDIDQVDDEYITL